MILRFLFTVWIVLGFLVRAAALQAAPIQQFMLANGLKVILLEEHKAPVVTFQIWYKVGSRNEITGKTGIAHLTEHMMFKGTTHRGKGEFSKTVAVNGGTENAFTDRDFTAYFENFSADHLDLSLELESDRMTNLLVNPKEFQLERDVVKEERRLRTEDDPQSFVIEQMYAMAFLAHPYHNPVIGWMNDIDHLTRDDVYNF
ncbi:MAG TPA: pitrilysin family protein, partial [Nitrospiria bacterium]|nr:pitrilysin family protein [Nitrospiria bacterium]